MQGTKISIDKEKIQELASQYSDTLAAKELGIAVSSFYLLRKKHGIPSFTQSTGNRRARKTGKILQPGEGVAHPQHANLKTDAFEVIDTEAKAYFLGLLAADGHSSWKPDAKFISIELQKPDSKVLKKLAELVNYEGYLESINREGKKPSERLLIYSRDLTLSLIKNGISATTETHFVSSTLPRMFRKDFLRGLIDGDGHVKFSGKALNLGTCSKVLVEEVSAWCLEEFQIVTSVTVKTLNSGKLFYTVTFGGKPRVILNWMYANASVYIERKKIQAELWLSLVE